MTDTYYDPTTNTVTVNLPPGVYYDAKWSARKGKPGYRMRCDLCKMGSFVYDDPEVIVPLYAAHMERKHPRPPEDIDD